MAVKPFVKWAGGKSKLCSTLLQMLPADVAQRRHVELFVGGGALFFARQPTCAALFDSNRDLIDTYEVVREDVEGLLQHLKSLQFLTTLDQAEDWFYVKREHFNTLHRNTSHTKSIRLEQAALFIYLNKTCFNGLYRVNKQGEFNTPYGRYKNLLIAVEKDLRDVSRCLKKTKFSCKSFEESFEDIRQGDFVYLDPPYFPISSTSNYTSYTSKGFDQTDQEVLHLFVKELTVKNIPVMLSNSDVPFIRKLYKKFRIDSIQAPRSINSCGNKRGAVSEVVIRNY